MFVIIPILAIVMYLVLIRPQQQRLRSQRQMVASLTVGDEIVSAGGIIGTIVALSDDRASVEVADGVVIEFLRAAINRKAPPSTVDLTEDDEPEYEEEEPHSNTPDKTDEGPH